MATVSLIARRKFGNGYQIVADVTMSSSYTTGGESITPSSLGLAAIDFVLQSTAGGYVFEFDHTNGKLKAFTTMPQHAHDMLITGGQAAGNAIQELSGVVGKTAAGNVTATGGTSNIQNRAASAATEVANGTNLSAVKVRVIAVGI